MALGDGTVWNEALPDNTTVANTIDNHNRDLRLGVRSRMALEHVWPSAHTGTSSAGRHTFLTFQAQAAAPTMAGTTAAGLYVTTEAQGALIFVGSDGTETTIINTAGTIGTGDSVEVAVITGGTLGSIPICSSASPTAILALTASAPGLTLHTNTNTGASTWEKIDLSDTGQVENSPTSMFSAWESKSNDTVYEATTDGFVTAWRTPAGTIEAYSDGNNPPTTLRNYSSSGNGNANVSFPVKKGDYWKVTGATHGVFWMPLGS